MYPQPQHLMCRLLYKPIAFPETQLLEKYGEPIITRYGNSGDLRS